MNRPTNMKRLNVRAGSMGRAVGALGVLVALRAALPEVEIVETGSDGAAWAAPVIALPPDAHGKAAAVGVTVENAVDVARSLLDGGEGDDALRSFFATQKRRLLARAGQIDPTSLEEARAAGAYVGLKTAISLSPEEVIETVKGSGLRGRGGAYFPLHLKWQSAREAAARNGRPFLVVNAEEGEPGVFKDRALMEADPHRLLEGMRIAAYAIGAEQTYCYINGQAHLSAERMQRAIDDATAAGIIGAEAGFTVEIRRGAGGYVCGEETVILESIEGKRAVPRLRPPFPTESGLWGRPTVINNVETLANLPDLFRFGVDWFREIGTEDAPGTKLISISGAVRWPGLLEVPMGTMMSTILAAARSGAVQGVVAGGPSGGLLPLAKLDTPIGPGAMDAAGAALGAGGVVAFDASYPAEAVVGLLSAYNARESCGKCTPCREGGERLADAVTRLREGEGDGDGSALADIDELLPLLRHGSLCGLGQMAVGPVASALQDFRAALTGGDSS